MKITKVGVGFPAALGAATLALGLLGAARAEHAHWLETPGTCVEDLGSGQTEISDAQHGGYHRLHVNFHLGVPGTVAFQNPQNPVSVGKVVTVPCP